MNKPQRRVVRTVQYKPGGLQAWRSVERWIDRAMWLCKERKAKELVVCLGCAIEQAREAKQAIDRRG